MWWMVISWAITHFIKAALEPSWYAVGSECAWQFCQFHRWKERSKRSRQLTLMCWSTSNLKSKLQADPTTSSTRVRRLGLDCRVHSTLSHQELTGAAATNASQHTFSRQKPHCLHTWLLVASCQSWFHAPLATSNVGRTLMQTLLGFIPHPSLTHWLTVCGDSHT